jgi:hypothetical protein
MKIENLWSLHNRKMWGCMAEIVTYCIKTLQSIKGVYPQSFVDIGASNQKLFQKLPNFSKKFNQNLIFLAIMIG